MKEGRWISRRFVRWSRRKCRALGCFNRRFSRDPIGAPCCFSRGSRVGISSARFDTQSRPVLVTSCTATGDSETKSRTRYPVIVSHWSGVASWWFYKDRTECIGSAWCDGKKTPPRFIRSWLGDRLGLDGQNAGEMSWEDPGSRGSVPDYRKPALWSIFDFTGVERRKNGPREISSKIGRRKRDVGHIMFDLQTKDQERGVFPTWTSEVSKVVERSVHPRNQWDSECRDRRRSNV